MFRLDDSENHREAFDLYKTIFVGTRYEKSAHKIILTNNTIKTPKFDNNNELNLIYKIFYFLT